MIRDKYSLVSELYELKDDMANSGREVCVRGWVRTNRNNGHIGFMAVNDGTCFDNVQIVYDMDKNPEFKEASKILTGCAVEAKGSFVITPEAKQPFEIAAQEITLVGDCDSDYPLQKKMCIRDSYRVNFYFVCIWYLFCTDNNSHCKKRSFLTSAGCRR